MMPSPTARLLLSLGVVAPLLSGCLTDNKVPVVTSELDQQMMGNLVNGNAVLDCQSQCVISWGARRQEFAQMNAAHDWHDLAIGVMQVGYQTDLGYFYLGRAAHGLGADQAAIRYYEIAAAISQGSNPGLKCKGLFDTCDGIAMPYILVTLIQQSQADLAKRQAEAAAIEEANAANASAARKHHTKKVVQKPAAIQQPSDIPLVEPPPVTR